MADNKLDIQISSEVGRGVYSNLAIITHSDNEFVIDFAAMLPGLPKAEVVSRVIMTPESTKKLLAALSENVQKYEDRQESVFPFNPSGNLS